MKDPSLNLQFSVSATSRKPRDGENEGESYYFLTEEEFKSKINNNEFVEWEEVYHGTMYGTLISEVEKIISSGNNLIMDIDVKGALNIKKRYQDDAVTIFIMPPDLQTLEERLRKRNTDTEETIARRLSKADYEISHSNLFDYVVINDKLEEAVKMAKDIVEKVNQE